MRPTRFLAVALLAVAVLAPSCVLDDVGELEDDPGDVPIVASSLTASVRLEQSAHPGTSYVVARTVARRWSDAADLSCWVELRKNGVAVASRSRSFEAGKSTCVVEVSVVNPDGLQRWRAHGTAHYSYQGVFAVNETYSASSYW